MIINQPFDIREDTCIPILDDTLLTGNIIDRGRKFPYKHKRDNQKTFDPLNKFIPSMRFQMIFHSISRRHQSQKLDTEMRGSEATWWSFLGASEVKDLWRMKGIRLVSIK